MYALKRWAARLLMAALLPAAAAAADLQLFTEENPPFNFIRDGQVTGLYPEVVAEILRRTGGHAPITLLPWARGYHKALHDADVGLFAMARTAQREKLFQWVGPLYLGGTAFYAKRGAGVRIDSLADAKALDSILVTRDWITHQMLIKRGFANIKAVTAQESVARMLLRGRAPVMFVQTRSVPALMRKIGARASDVELIFSVTKNQGHIAFSLGTSPDLVRRWQQALDEMKRDGSYAAIFSKWLPGETPPGIEPTAAPTLE
ncbi:MAG: substrate-binding periplasmic protein [Pseudomonas sp.]